MLRMILLAMVAPLVIACQSTGPSVVDPSPQATLGESITEPTDGIENETTQMGN